jgi:general L-amino acid transport system substrate-binding protein
MRGSVFRGLLAAAGLVAGSAPAATLDDVMANGKVTCGISPGPSATVSPESNGWNAFDAAFCRALAAAVLGDAEAVTLVPTRGDDAVALLSQRKIDVLVRDRAWTLSRDADYGIDFVSVTYYDGQGFLVPKTLGVTTAKELDGHKVCVVTGDKTGANLDDFSHVNNLSLAPVPETDQDAAVKDYLDGKCDVFTAQRSQLAALRSTFGAPTDHVILPDIISKEPLGPAVREGDDAWADIVRWTLFALIAAEELGITSANVDEMAKAASPNPEINRLLGTEGDLGSLLGLPTGWAYMAIKAGGNYGEIFARTIGEATPIGLPRGLNALWRDGGLLYSPPFR